jgi:two-component system chemotaxis response regulator CheB
LVSHLPKDFPAPIFAVIHIPPDYPSMLPRVLSSAGPLRAVHPANHEAFRPGVIYIAPPDYHLLVGSKIVTLSKGPRENRHRPSIDTLFRSAARWHGFRVTGVVLSGFLDDGSAGLIAIKMRRGIAIVQDPQEALSPEMPRSAIEYAKVDHVLPVAKIADLMSRLALQEAPPEATAYEIKMENKIDNEVRQANLEEEPPKEGIGQPSEFACPDCGGVLLETNEKGLLRFRCRVGHAYTAEALKFSMSQSSEDALWAAMRALEEKSALWRRLAPQSSDILAARYSAEAELYDKHAQEIRRILLETQTAAEAGQDMSRIA